MQGIAQPQVAGVSVIGATPGSLASSRIVSGGITSTGAAPTGITSTITSSFGAPGNKGKFDYPVMNERHISSEELASSGNLIEGPSLPPIGDRVGAVNQMSSRISAPTAITAPAARAVAYEPLTTMYGELPQAAPARVAAPSTIYGELPQAAPARVAAPSVTHVSSVVQNSPGVHIVQAAPAVSTVPAVSRALFDSIDKNHDGVISRAEFNQAMANGASASARNGRMPVAII